jgi:DNA-binding Lrp family transcriptional regulator
MERLINKEELINLLDKKISVRAMAKEVGCSHTTLIKRVKEHGLSNYGREYRDKDILSKLYLKENKTISEIASIYGASQITISKYIKKFELKKTIEAKASATLTKRKATCQDLYGVDNVMQLEKTKQAAKNTSIDRYGAEHYSKTEEWRTKAVAKNLKKYGVKWTLDRGDVKEKISTTLLRKYGVTNPSFIKGISDKKRETLLKNHSGSKGIVHNIEGYTSRQISDLYNIPYSSVNYFINKYQVDTLKSLKEIADKSSSGQNGLEKFAEKEFKLSFYDKQAPGVGGYRPDFLVKDGIYMNADGLYWHSELRNNDKWYHFNLRKKFEENNYRILQFRENEILKKTELVKSMLSHLSGNTPNKIHGRKTVFEKLSIKQARSFLDRNHIKGFMNSNHYGLMLGGAPVAIMSVRLFGSTIKVDRFCTKMSTVVNGGFSKLLKNISELYEFDKIDYWVDLRYGSGSFLKNYGFKIKKETLGWEWTDLKNTYNRLKCRANMDNRMLSQADHASELKLVKIYDAGQRLWIKELR